MRSGRSRSGSRYRSRNKIGRRAADPGRGRVRNGTTAWPLVSLSRSLVLNPDTMRNRCNRHRLVNVGAGPTGAI